MVLPYAGVAIGWLSRSAVPMPSWESTFCPPRWAESLVVRLRAKEPPAVIGRKVRPPVVGVALGVSGAHLPRYQDW